MQRKTKVLTSLVITLGLLNLVTLHNGHQVKKELNQSQSQLKQTKFELNKLFLELEKANGTVLQTKSQLEAERMKNQTLQKSLTDLQKEVNELREQNEQLQREKLERVRENRTSRLSSRGGSVTRTAKVLHMVGTAYTNRDSGMNGQGITATGTRTTEGRTVAVDTRIIPLGTKLRITSASYPAINGVYVAEDTGGAIKGYKLDIYFESKSRALEFGVRRDLVVEILE